MMHNIFFLIAPEGKTPTSVSRYRSKPSFSIRSVPVWQPGQDGAPFFDEESYEVAKYAVFEVRVSTK